MEMGSDMGVPLVGTRLSIWPLPVKQGKEQTARAQVIQVGRYKIAFDDLYGQYYARVYAYLRFRVGSPEVAEDLVSLVFERALTHLADLQSPAPGCFASLATALPIISGDCALRLLSTFWSTPIIPGSVRRRR
ncbi:MAG TPA: sigma factor [Ktedonobacteraceae bacterium]|nr:sigma factor [Ktedonobacteraceae bacterium]